MRSGGRPRAKDGVARKRRPVGLTASRRQGERVGRRDWGLRGEVCQGVGVVGVGGGGSLVGLGVGVVLSGGGRKAARGLRMVVKISLVRSMMAGFRGKPGMVSGRGGEERFL